MSASDLTVLGSGFFWGSFRVLLDSFGVSGFSWAAQFPCLQDTLTNVPGKRKTFETEKQHESEICMATEMEMGGVRSSQEKKTAITTPLQFYGALSCSARKLNKKKKKGIANCNKSQNKFATNSGRSLALAHRDARVMEL